MRLPGAPRSVRRQIVVLTASATAFAMLLLALVLQLVLAAATVMGCAVVPDAGRRSVSFHRLLQASSTRYSSASGFCVGWTVTPPFFSRSCPPQIGNSQSLRICSSSFSVFMLR